MSPYEVTEEMTSSHHHHPLGPVDRATTCVVERVDARIKSGHDDLKWRMTHS